SRHNRECSRGFSCEQSVHEPSDRWGLVPLIRRFAFIETVAKDPEAQARFILDAEIIPRRTVAVLLPPFHGDAFGPLHPHHRVRDAAPGELMRRRRRARGRRARWWAP